MFFGKQYQEREVIEVPKMNEFVERFWPGNQEKMYTINPFHANVPFYTP